MPYRIAVATAEIAALHIAPTRTDPRIAIAAVAVRDDVVAAIRDFVALGFIEAPYRLSVVEAARAWIAAARG